MRHFAPKYKSFVSYACVMDKRFPALWNTMNEHVRQREILVLALENPTLTCDYEEHSQRFGTSYNTVRNDMGTPISLGLFYPAYNGHRMVLHAAPDVLGTLERLAR